MDYINKLNHSNIVTNLKIFYHAINVFTITFIYVIVFQEICWHVTLVIPLYYILTQHCTIQCC